MKCSVALVNLQKIFACSLLHENCHNQVCIVGHALRKTDTLPIKTRSLLMLLQTANNWHNRSTQLNHYKTTPNQKHYITAQCSSTYYLHHTQIHILIYWRYHNINAAQGMQWYVNDYVSAAQPMASHWPHLRGQSSPVTTECHKCYKGWCCHYGCGLRCRGVRPGAVQCQTVPMQHLSLRSLGQPQVINDNGKPLEELPLQFPVIVQWLSSHGRPPLLANKAVHLNWVPVAKVVPTAVCGEHLAAELACLCL